MDISAEIYEFLTKKFELSDKEVELYLYLLKNSPTTVLEAAEATGIKRPTVHANLETLLQKNLIKQVHKGQGSRRALFAEPPEKLAILMEQKKSELALAEKQLPSIIEKLSGLVKETQESNTNNMEVRYYHGKNEVRFIYEEASKAKEFRAYLNCKKLSNAFPNNPNKFIEVLEAREDMQMWEIVEDSLEARDYALKMPQTRYHCRIAPSEANLSVIDYMMFDDNVAIVNFNSSINGIMISDSNVYQNNKAIFEFIWRVLKPYKG
ncbi:MAG: winged helix-turn-helix transcriptional regulator [Gammaproteobacteria bacterium]|nr:winged helix-turn-helix transcriptional regulator [Gammaproteobacteria bacterium]